MISLAVNFQYCDRFRKYDFATYAHTCKVGNLILNGVQFFQRLEGEPDTVYDLVSLCNVPKDDWITTNRVGWHASRVRRRIDHIRHFHDWPAKQCFTEHITKHRPQGSRLAISKQPQRANRVVAHHPCPGRTIP